MCHLDREFRNKTRERVRRGGDRREPMKGGRGMKVLEDKSRGIETLMTET
jgi:hypothetical protein